MLLEIPTKRIRTASFNLWAPDPIWPDKVYKPRAIIVLTGGSNSDSRDMVGEKQWRTFAFENHCILIGTFFQDKDPSDIEGYCKAQEESGECLLWAIKGFSDELGINLETVPLFLWGFSAGGQFNYEMNAAFPQRVDAFVVNKGGIYYSALVNDAARETPGLFFTGQKDEQWRQDIVKGLVSVNRRAGALWHLCQEKTGHEVGASVRISQQFFKNVLKRLEEDSV